MLYPIFLFIISILGIIFTYQSVTGKIKICRKWTGYICIIMIPVFLILFPYIFLKSFIDEYSAYYTFVPIGMIGIEAAMLLCYVVINFSLFPKKFLNEDESKQSADIKGARLLINYSLCAALFYLVPILALIYAAVMLALCAVGTLLMPMFLIVLTVPIALLSGIVFSVTGILCVLIVVLSINSVIRASYYSQGVRKHIIRHVIFMFIPVFNMISLFQISRQCKKDIGIQ